MTTPTIKMFRTFKHTLPPRCSTKKINMSDVTYKCCNCSYGSAIKFSDITSAIALMAQGGDRNFYSVINPSFIENAGACIENIKKQLLRFFTDRNVEHVTIIGGKAEDSKVAQCGIRIACDTADFCDQKNIPVSLICGKYNENTEDNVKLLKNSVSLWGEATSEIPINPSKEQLIEYLSDKYKYAELSDIAEVKIYDSYNPKNPEANAEFVS